jgi:ubiquinone/menaquinone biosynthesis C-methylase UbiE
MVATVTRSHPIFARVYGWLARPDQHGDEQRRETLAGLSGRVLEVGAGNGLNFRHYPAEVTEVLAVEPEPFLRGKAEAAARKAPVPVRVVPGMAESLPARDGEFDAAVASLVLCSVPRPDLALAELRRVLKPGGELRVYEHVLSEEPGKARSQRRIARWWPRLAGGCHPDRDTPAAVEAAGFEWERLRRFSYTPGPGLGAVEPHVIGVARRSA